MEFIVSSSALLAHLGAVKGVISSKTALPILDNFLFELEDSVLTITASDLETTLRTNLTLDKATGNGIIAIEAKRLTDILKEFSNEQPLTFKIDTASYKVEIVTQSGKFSVMGQSGDEFPKLPELNQSTASTIQMTASLFLKGIQNTLFATADDELRPVMNGILVELRTNHFRMVATDSHKLVRFTRTDITAEKDSQFILPKKTANILKGILAKEQADIRVEFDEKNAHFTLPQFTVVCRLVEGKYPAYGAVIPTNNINKMTVDRYNFYTSLRRVSLCASQSSNLIKLSLNGNNVEVSAQDIDFSVSAYENVVCQFDGEAMNIGFKSNILLEALSNISASDVVLELSDPSRAGLIVPLENETSNEDVLMLVMPMSIS